MVSLHGRDGKKYLRHGKAAVWRNDDLQSFTPLRFLPPSKLAFRGRAVVIDPDVFALIDVRQLLFMDMQGKSILCRHICPTDGRRPYWATSVMLLDCEKLQHWRWEESLEEMFDFKRDYRDWMSLWLEDQASIGVLADEWNHYDVLNGETKMLHNTGRLTQPWKTGLPVDFTTDDHFKRSLPSRLVRSLASGAKRFLGSESGPEGSASVQVYQKHPDERQERLFFDLLHECLAGVTVTREELHDSMAKNHIRKDALEIVDALRETAAG
jgi:hypothetical protein